MCSRFCILLCRTSLHPYSSTGFLSPPNSSGKTDAPTKEQRLCSGLREPQVQTDTIPFPASLHSEQSHGQKDKMSPPPLPCRNREEGAAPPTGNWAWENGLTILKAAAVGGLACCYLHGNRAACPRYTSGWFPGNVSLRGQVWCQQNRAAFLLLTQNCPQPWTRSQSPGPPRGQMSRSPLGERPRPDVLRHAPPSSSSGGLKC